MNKLVLSEQQSLALRGTAETALKNAGRIEFGPSIVDPLVEAFSDSPYLTAEDCEETLAELVSLFYLFKNETLDRISDESLIKYMKKSFDGDCAGSVELLASDALPTLAAKVKRKFAFPELTGKEV